MDASINWQAWIPPYDPRWANGVIVTEDEHGRLIETADCGTRCPGCGICCAGYRDVITEDYAGVEEYESNLKPARGGLVKQEDGSWYRAATCGETCPGYGQCCQPFDLRHRPETVADAERILLEDVTSHRWAMQEAMLTLAHEGTDQAVAVLEAYMPVAHTKLAGFGECALDEGRYFASVPSNAEEELEMMKLEVRQAWEERVIEAQTKIWETIEPELARWQYEMMIAQRLLSKAQDEASRETWQTQVDVYQMLVIEAKNDLEKEQEELALCEAMIAEIDADLAASD